MAMVALVASASLSGCRTVDTMRNAPLNEGVLRTYAGEYYDVTRAAYEAVQSLGLTVDEVKQIDPATWNVIATASASAFSWGELVRVSVQRRAAPQVAVWVLTKRRLATNITAKDDYSPDVFQRMDFTLRLRQPAASWSAPATQ
jgi:hypothetical protein